MSPKQAIAAAVKIDPERTYCAVREDWKHSHYAAHKPNFRLSVIPGLDGTDCQIFRGNSYVACVVAYYDANEIASKTIA